MNMKKTALTLSAAAFTVLLPISQSVAAISGQVEVRLVIDEGCQVTNVDSGDGSINDFGILDFGTHSPTWNNTLAADLSGLSSSSAALEVECNAGRTEPVTISINEGMNAAGTQRQVSMGAGGDVVPYNVYSDASRTTEYAANTPQSFTLDDTGKVTIPVYGRITANETAKAKGTYTDTLVVTLDF